MARRRFSLVVVLVAGTASIAFALNAGRMLVVDAPQHSDLILVLAGETERRPVRALELLDQGYAPKVLIDVPAEVEIFGTTEIELANKWVRDLPTVQPVSICPIEALSTRDETRDVQRCLAGQNVQRILIVTSEFHTSRALSIFRHEMRDRTFSVASAPDSTQFGTRWWTHRQWAKVCLDEWLRTGWWNVIERWR